MALVTSDNRGLRLAARYAVLMLVAVIFVFPLLFMAMSSLKPDQQLLSRHRQSCGRFFPVGDISFNNYFAAFERAPIGVFVFNSVLVNGDHCRSDNPGLLACGICVRLSRLDRARDVVFSILLATLIIPYETIFIPLLLMASQLPWIGARKVLEIGWLNTYRVQIIPFHRRRTCRSSCSSSSSRICRVS